MQCHWNVNVDVTLIIQNSQTIGDHEIMKNLSFIDYNLHCLLYSKKFKYKQNN